jgi:hypothetical protein
LRLETAGVKLEVSQKELQMTDQEERSDTLSRYAQNIGRALRPAPEAVVITTTDNFYKAALAARNTKFETVIIDEQTVMTHEEQPIQPQMPKF